MTVSSATVDEDVDPRRAAGDRRRKTELGVQGWRSGPWIHGEERGGSMLKCPDAERRQLQRMILVGFIALLVPAMIGRLTGWRWRPWPPGPTGYSSVIAEAKAAADTYIPLGFIEW